MTSRQLRFTFGLIGMVCLGLLARAADEPIALTPAVTFKGHQNVVYSAAFSPDGTLVATGSFDQAIKLWDAKTGKEVRTFAGTTGHQNLVLSVAFSPDGGSLASGASDNTARVWDVPTSAPVRDFPQTAAARGVAVSPDGKLLAVPGADGSIKLWNTADGKPAGNLIGHPGGATGVSFTPNGTTLVSSGVDGILRYWNPATGLQLGQVGAHAGSINGVVTLPGNTGIASVGDDGTLKWWLIPPTPARLLPGHGDAVTALVLSSDGSQALTGGADKVVKLSNAVNGQLTRDFTGAASTPQAVAMNSTMVAAGGADGKLTFWKVADGKLQAQVPAHAGGVTGLAFQSGQPIVASVGADGMLRLWSLPTNGTRSIATPDRVLATATSTDGNRLFTAGADKVVRSWTTATGAPERQFTGHTAAVTALASHPDNTTLASASADESIRFWNVTNGTQTGQLAGHTGPIHSLALAGQGNLLASAGEDGSVKFWQLPVAAKSLAHADAVGAIALSNDGNRLLTIGNDKQVRVWNLVSGQVERTYTAGSGAIAAACFAPDANINAVAGADKSLTTWNAGKEVKKFPALPAQANALAYSTDGNTLAAGLADNSLRLFNVGEGKEIKNIPGHTGPITALLYSPKGDVLFSASTDKSIRLWNPADGVAKGQFAHAGPVTGIAIARDGTRLAAGGDKSVSLWTLADSKPAGTITLPSEVKSVGFSPDGQKLAVACVDGKVRLFGIDGKLQEIFAHEGPAASVVFHPDGKRVISSSADKTARIWTSTFVGQGHHTGPVRQVLVTPQGDRAFSVGDDRHLRIWDAKTGKEIKAIPSHDAAVVGLALTADLSKAITAGADKTAKVWNVADGKLLTTIPLPAPAQRIALAANGTKLAVAMTEQGAKVRTYDPVSGKELQLLAEPAGPVQALQFLPDGRTLVFAGDDKQATLVEALVTQALPVHAGGAIGVALLPAPNLVITAGKDKTVKQWDTTTGKDRVIATLPDVPTAFALSRDATVVAVGVGKTLKLFQVADGREIASIAHPADVLAINFNADRTRVVSGASDNLARVFEVAGGRFMQSFSHGAAVQGVAYHPTLPQIFSASADKTVSVGTISLTRQVQVSPGPVRAVTVLPSGTHIITGATDKSAKGYNAGTGNEERTLTGAEGPVHAVAVSRNSATCAVAGADKTIRVYTMVDAKQIGSIAAPAAVNGLAFHPTLPILVAGCEDKSVNAWNIAFTPGQPLPPEFGRAVQSFTHGDAVTAVAFAEQGPLFSSGNDKLARQWRIAADGPVKNFAHPALVDAVAFDPTGKLLATGCHDGQLRIFDIEKNNTVNAIVAHQQTMPEQRTFQIYAIAWTPDGKQILTASYDRSMKLWDLTSGKMVREFKPYHDKEFPKGHRDQIFCAVFTKDGKFVATGSSDRMIKLWNVADGSVVREFANANIKQMPAPESPEAHPGWVYGLRFSADEKTLYSVGSAPKNRGYLAAWNVADGKMLSAQQIANGPIYSVSLSKDGSQLLFGCGSADRQVPAAEALLVPVPK